MEGRHALVPVRKRKKRPVTDASYAAMLIRMSLGYAKRIGANRGALAFLRDIEEANRDAVNLGIYMAHYRDDGESASLAEIGRELGISKQAVAKRVNLGREVADRLQLEGKLPPREVTAS